MTALLPTVMPKRARQQSASSSSGPSAQLSRKERGSDWPAPKESMDMARQFIRDTVAGSHKALLVPDKDADGLSSALILYRTLLRLGLPETHVSLHFIPKGSNIHAPEQRAALSSRCTRLFVFDQGSRPGPPIVDSPELETLIIDHHYSTNFPHGAHVLSACMSEPIATTSLLTYLLCEPLHHKVNEMAWLALLGVYGDLGAGLRKSFPDVTGLDKLEEEEKRWGRKKLGEAVGLLNAPRRTAEFNVPDAWAALLSSHSPPDLAGSSILTAARIRTKAETTRWQGAPPVFSKDGRVAVVMIASGYQIHPVLATRWASTLRKARTLLCVICANTAYTSGYVHFSARPPKRPASDGPPPNLIDFLKSCMPLCEALSPGWGERVGEDFGRGHREATGGIIKTDEFDVLCRALEIGVKPEKKEGDGKGKGKGTGQTTLDRFFKVEGGNKEEHKRV